MDCECSGRCAHCRCEEQAEQVPTISEKSFFPKNIRREYLRTYRYTDNSCMNDRTG
jgi:hypothetical protein